MNMTAKNLSDKIKNMSDRQLLEHIALTLESFKKKPNQIKGDYCQKVDEFFKGNSEYFDDLKETYGNVDQHIKEARAWLISNPQKPKKNFKRFLNAWIQRNNVIQVEDSHGYPEL